MYDMFMSNYQTDSRLLVHAQPIFCRELNYDTNLYEIKYGEGFNHLNATGADIQFVDDEGAFNPCMSPDLSNPMIYEVETYR